MVDVRSMLRAERANRRVTHPNASYTSDGKLLCNLCEVMVKTEAAWQGHLHSTGHTLRLSRAKEAAAARGAESKKRKASSIESSPTAEERKRARPEEASPNVEDIAAEEEAAATRSDSPNVETTVPAEQVPAATTNGTAPAPQPAPADSVEDAELAAFERELAEMEHTAGPTTAYSAGATISAAPVTAEELAAQAREEQSAQRGRRDVEIEAEREDAARLMEDELEEMEGLEERVRKLRERREALRKGSTDVGDCAEATAAVEAESAVNGHTAAKAEDDDEEDDEEYDDWQFGGR